MIAPGASVGYNFSQGGNDALSLSFLVLSGAGQPMLAKLNTFALVGIDAVPVEAEVDASAGLPKTVLVGLPELAVRESIHPIERALANPGYDRHPRRTALNLSPPALPTQPAP